MNESERGASEGGGSRERALTEMAEVPAMPHPGKFSAPRAGCSARNFISPDMKRWKAAWEKERGKEGDERVLERGRGD